MRDEKEGRNRCKQVKVYELHVPVYLEYYVYSPIIHVHVHVHVYQRCLHYTAH